MKLIDILKQNQQKDVGKVQKTNNIRIDRYARIDYNLYVKKPRKDEIDIKSVKSDNKEKATSEKKENVKIKEKKKIFIDDKIKRIDSEKYKIKEPEKEKANIELDDYELNHLPYEKAVEIDKRSCCKIYWSIIKRDELILFTLIPWNDYNLFYIKTEKFFFTILNLMAMNAFLFADKTIHKFYINGVKYNLIQQILQIILSIIITHILEIVLCCLSMTDRYIYEIRAVSKTERDGKKIVDILTKMKINLIIFFCSLLLVSIFYWYFISAFCAVYNNTQEMYIIDCLLSFIFFSIDPFIVYALVSLIRFIAIKKKVKWLYVIGTFFPIF